jgi:hypothetical protein
MKCNEDLGVCNMVACDQPFDVGLIELVRWLGPLRGEACAKERNQPRGEGEEIAHEQK